MPKQLIEGLQRFRNRTFPSFQDRFEELVQAGQTPSTLFIGCSDSRVLPNLVMDAGPGELFTIRNVGALVPPHDGSYHDTAAGIEFAVGFLHVTDIVVCAHSHCGAMKALYEPPGPEHPHLERWLELAQQARVDEPPTEETLRRTEQRSAAIQVERLLTYPAVARRVEEGALTLHAWHYLMEEGQVLGLDLDRGSFQPLN